MRVPTPNTKITVEFAADRPETHETVVDWHVREWGSEWGDLVRSALGKNGIPTTLVALEGDTPVGTALLVREDMTTRKDLGPWMGGVYVHPDHRGKGVGELVIKTAMDQAAILGVETLWLYAAKSTALYEKMGWSYVSSEEYLGETVAIMKHSPPLKNR